MICRCCRPEGRPARMGQRAREYGGWIEQCCQEHVCRGERVWNETEPRALLIPSLSLFWPYFLLPIELAQLASLHVSCGLC